MPIFAIFKSGRFPSAGHGAKARRGACAMILSLCVTISAPLSAQTAGDLFAGKTVQVIIGAGPGGGNDTWGRVIARYLGARLPGTPTVIARNMPGGGSMVAANHIYNIAPKDGTELGLITRDTVVAPLSGANGARFDVTKMTWIGSPTVDTTICFSSAASGVRLLDDLKDKQLVVGNTGAGTASFIYPNALNALLGLKFKSITGFPSSADVFLAIERNEVNGTCGALATLMTLRPDWIREKRVSLLAQISVERNAELQDTPSALEFAKDPETRTALNFLVAPESLGRPVIAPPGLDAARVKALRDGLQDILKDPGLIKDAKSQKLDVNPITGEQLTDLVRSIYATPKPIVDRVNALAR